MIRTTDGRATKLYTYQCLGRTVTIEAYTFREARDHLKKEGKVMDEEETGIEKLDRLYPIQYGGGGLVGLGQFIQNLFKNPGDPETDAENVALAVLGAMLPAGEEK